MANWMYGVSSTPGVAGLIGSLLEGLSDGGVIPVQRGFRRMVWMGWDAVSLAVRGAEGSFGCVGVTARTVGLVESGSGDFR